MADELNAAQGELSLTSDDSSLYWPNIRSLLIARGRADSAILKTRRPDDGSTVLIETRGLAEQSDPQAQNAFGNLLCSLADELSERRWEGFENAGAALQEQQDLYYAEAVLWYRKAIAQNHADAMVSLANLYNKGGGVAEDLNEALKLWRAAAEQGHAEGQHMLGLHYSVGKGVPQDFSEASKWLRKSAEQGDAWAQYDLAVVCAVCKDFDEATDWLRKSVEQQFDEAKKFLARLYREGKIVPLDETEAQKWIALKS